jgi:hypothetical protein
MPDARRHLTLRLMMDASPASLSSVGVTLERALEEVLAELAESPEQRPPPPQQRPPPPAGPPPPAPN